METILARERKKSWTVTIVFASAGLIRKLNKQYRGRKGLTDVLAFEMRDDTFAEGGKDKNLGDVYICVDVAKKQARELGHSFTRELMKLSAHGTLHLLGYDHGNDKDRRAMSRKEERYISLLETRSK